MNNVSTSVVCHLMLTSAKEFLAKLVSVPKTPQNLIQFLLICREDIYALNLVMTSPLNFIVIDITITFNCQLGAHLTKQ